MTTTWPPLGESSCGGEGSAKEDGCTEEAKVRFRHVGAVDLLGNGAGEVEAGTTGIEGSHVLKDTGWAFQVLKLTGEATGPLPSGEVLRNCTMRSGSG